jgi:hypothetical protein
MSLDRNAMLESLKRYNESPEGKATEAKYFTDMVNKDRMEQSQLQRFWDRYQYKDSLNFIIQRVIDKYDGKYRDSEYKKGYEPREPLLWFLYEVAKKFGREFTEDEYRGQKSLMFTADIHVLGSYTFELLQGQGCALMVNKIIK